ncbi:MAG: hypothetical protein AB7O52_18585 [Planctomycetota bacterium]
MDPLDADGCASVDAALKAWRQGDCVVGEQWFVFRTDTTRPLTNEGAVAATEGTDTAESEVRGFMVLTQTCDLVRKSSERPFVEAYPLVEVDKAQFREIERSRRPNYAFVPTLADHLLVADLDRVMTVEKAVVAGWHRVAGWQTDAEARRIALALARKRARAAFPDDFVAFATPLKRLMSDKHDQQSDYGRALRALREVRVRAEPSWTAKKVKLMFWFIRNEDEPTFEDHAWHSFLASWQQLIPRSGRFVDVQAVVQTLEDLTAREYVESDPLDLDHLTTRNR